MKLLNIIKESIWAIKLSPKHMRIRIDGNIRTVTGLQS